MQDYSCLGQLCILFTWRKATLARPVTWCCTTGNPPLKVAQAQGEIYVNSYSRQTMHRGKVDPGVSELPRGSKRLFPQVEVKSRKTKQNGISHLREMDIIHQTGGILTSKPTFIQGVSEKLPKKRGTQIASCAHIYMAF